MFADAPDGAPYKALPSDPRIFDPGNVRAPGSDIDTNRGTLQSHSTIPRRSANGCWNASRILVATLDREGLARDFGSSVVLHGGVDNQETPPFGKPDDVRREVADNIRIFKDCKWYLVKPSHNIQPNTLTENILALYAAVE